MLAANDPGKFAAKLRTESIVANKHVSKYVKSYTMCKE